ncbi:nucleoside diphosphate kinase regulator [Marinobacter sp. BGYM27]|uniref:nucleoside diphosphate kinase regulator n=1 Tax=Marinobacter sp. BGYM27 TaxID=2975597 RepID=UPI0021A860E7|nr:nucleoside diphosphate kinase regulator [Marinobacter sp. BGYM27]MDG5499570.1 nucleoside diphosphate kinase regulator [Marinobacter sp. BGYM27]
MSDRPAITITQQDHDRLWVMLERQTADTETTIGLEEELSRATLVPAGNLPANIVAMNSTVRFMNEDNQREHELKLVYPSDAKGAEGCVSILAPAGSALLGLSVGDRIEWPVNGRNMLHLKIIQVTDSSQPAV